MYEAIARNRWRSFLLVLALGLLLGACGFGMLESVSPGTGLVGALLGYLLALVMAIVAWLAGDRMILWSNDARRIEHADHPELHNVVEEMAIAAGLPKPRVYLIDDPAPNAFATGRSPDKASVAVTQGLLARLDRVELQGVVAHELGHVQNRDTLFMTLVGVLVGAIDTIANLVGRSSRRSSRSRTRSGKSEGGLIVVVALLIGVVAPLLARLLYLAASRQREYLADATGAFLTRYPAGLASALERIRDAPTRLPVAASTAALCILNPLQVEGGSDGLAGLFSTHPPTGRRISILRGMAGDGDYETYERAFHRVVGGTILRIRAAPAQAQRPAAAAIRTRPPNREVAVEERIRTFRAARDVTRAAAGYRFVRCVCGLQLRFPANLGRPAVRCPRCRRTVQVPATE